MPIPKNLLNNQYGIVNKTPNGIDYLVLHDGYAERYAVDASEIDAEVIIGWEDRDDFLTEVLGYTTWDGTSNNLNRNLPLQCPLDTDLWLETATLSDKGMIPRNDNPGAATPTFDAANSDWPKFDWVQYRLHFVRPKWWVRSDATLASNYGNKEQFRYVIITTRYVPRERKKPGYTFQYTDPNTSKVVPIDEVGFTPDYSIEYIVTWKQVPINAVPWAAITAALFSVNLSTFPIGISALGAASWPVASPGGLAFKGLQNPIGWYQGADGNFYVDLVYVFSQRPGPGWNFYQLNCQTTDTPPQWLYAAITARNCSGGTTPPFISTNFQALFTPASA